MDKIYDTYIETSFGGSFEQHAGKFGLFEKNYKKYFPQNSENAYVLDVGIGRGEMLHCMKEWGYQYNGLDISPSTVKFCQSLDLNCEISSNTETWLNDHKSSFDLVTCLDVLEHIPKDNVIDFVVAIRNSLKEDGKVIIQVPNLQSPFGYLLHFTDITHITGFVENSLEQVLVAAGFKKFEFHGLEEVYPANFKSLIKKIIRYFFYKWVRLLRLCTNHPNPEILEPMIFVVAYK